jgi:hypothetical protein
MEGSAAGIFVNLVDLRRFASAEGPRERRARMRREKRVVDRPGKTSTEGHFE